MPGVALRTSRLELRPLSETDCPRIAALAGDWDVARMTGQIPHPYSVADAQHWLADLDANEMVSGIVHSGVLIGVCGYTIDDTGRAEVGYWIGRSHWGSGFATEAAGALVGHCFDAAGLAHLTCSHFVDNKASARVIGKLGFRFMNADLRWCEARQTHVETLHYVKLNPALLSQRMAFP